MKRTGYIDGRRLAFLDDYVLPFGTGKDVNISWDGDSLNILPLTNNIGVLEIGNGTLSMDVKIFGFNANNYILWDNSAGRLTLQRIYATVEEIAAYEYGQYIGMAFGVTVPTGKYISGLKIAVEGEADFDVESAVWPLWIDYQNVGADSSTLDGAIRISCQAGACKPDTYFALQSAMPGVEHFVRFEVYNEPVSEGYNGSFGGTVRKISIDIAGVEYYLVAATQIT